MSQLVHIPGMAGLFLGVVMVVVIAVRRVRLMTAWASRHLNLLKKRIAGGQRA